MDFTVDGDGDAIFQARRQAWMAMIQFTDQSAHGQAGHLVLDLTVCVLPRQPARKDDRGHRRGNVADQSSAASRTLAASSAADSFGGDIGKSVMRTPVASAMAFPIAAIGGTIGTSPTPRTP